MKLAKVLAATAAVSMISGHALAQDLSSYATIGVKTVEFDTYSVEGRAGYHFTKNIAAELQGSIGVIGESIDFAGISTDTNEDYSLAAFIKAEVPVGDRFSILARLGYALSGYGVDVTANNTTTSVTVEPEGLAYGAGAQFMFDERNGVRIEYTAYDFGTVGGQAIGTADTASLSFVRKF